MPRFLSELFDVRRGEKLPALLGALFFFSVMAALMMLRPAREALGMQRGIDSVRWLFIGTAVVTLAVNPVFGWLVSRFRRLPFISATYGFFAFSLLVFWGILIFAPAAVGVTTGQVFYIWFSVFNLFAVMVCWALLADRFSLDQGKRLFPVISAGGTLGAIFGPWLSSVLVKPLGTPALLPVAAGFLILGVFTAWGLAHEVPGPHDGAVEDPAGTHPPSKEDDHAVIGGAAWGGFQAVIRSRYLLGIAVYIVTLAIILTFIYFTRLQMVAALGRDLDMTTGVFARLDMITQVTTLVLQLGITSYLMKRFGVSVTMALLPLTVLLGFIGLAIVSTLTMVVILDAASKAVQRAIMRPARETLFTVLGREDKYKAKAFIDTFVYRGGDVIGAQVEGLLKSLGLGLAALASLAIPMSIAWTFLGVWLGRSQIATAARMGLLRPGGAPAREKETGGSIPVDDAGRARRLEAVRGLARSMAASGGLIHGSEIAVLTTRETSGAPGAASASDAENPVAVQADGGRYFAHVRRDGRGEITMKWPDGAELVIELLLP